MAERVIPVDFGPAWPRTVANIVNRLLGKAVQKDGQTIYAGDTAGVSYDQAKMQALMDAVEALSNRLE